MGILDVFKRSSPQAKAGEFTFDTADYARADLPVGLSAVLSYDVEHLWRTQPYLRMVVTFMARNIAQLGLHVFERVSDTDRRRRREHPVSYLLRRPNANTTGYELIYGLVADLALHDKAYWMITEDAAAEAGYTLTRIPPSWVVTENNVGLYGPDSYDVLLPSSPVARPVLVPAERMVTFRGWAPSSTTAGVSPVEALKQILAEQIEAARYREQVWRRGGRVSSVLSRPSGAPEWSDAARQQFKADWRSKFTGSGPEAGGTPVLEDGMSLQRVDYSAHEQQFVEAAKLALDTVAQVYHINPTMIGQTDNASYSNVREFRKMLYGDTLGPLIKQVEDRITTFLLPAIGGDDVYVEFNIAEKLAGNFEEQTQAIQSAVGRPWMSADEARGRFNMPAVGGDASRLVVPLNVLTGGQASPNDSGEQNRRAGPVSFKARANQTHVAKAEQVLAAFFDRQGRVVRSAMPVKADEAWWDAERWNRELRHDLAALGVQTSAAVAAEVLDANGFGPGLYDVAATEAFVGSLAERIAEQVNITTKGELDAARAADDPAAAVSKVFTNAVEVRAVQGAAAVTTAMSSFGAAEAARQVAGDGQATKTWRTTSGNPRSSHAAMSGETVGIDEQFSNGADWPGDASLGVDETAGCECELEITIGGAQ